MKRILRSALLSTTVAIVILANPAFAAQVGDNEQSQGLNEIVVTAQKRAENLQQTPMAITAISTEDIDLRGISEVKDIGAIAPNVQILQGTTNATAAVISIRGIPTPADETQGFDSPIGLYLDGVYLARSASASFEVADIERIEVLRGPQGTLFGRNTTGGAINFITRLPADEAGARLRLGVGNYGLKNVRVVLDSGLMGGVVKTSIGYLHKQRNGVVDNLLAPSGRDPGSSNTESVRWATRIEPADWLKITNIFDWTQIESIPHAFQLAELGDGSFRPDVNIGGHTFSQVQPANVAGHLASSIALEPQCGDPLASVSRSRLDRLCMAEQRLSTDEVWGNLFRVEADLGSVTVRSSTAYRKWSNLRRGADLDGLGNIQGPLFSEASLLNGMPASTLSLFLPEETANYLAGQPVPTTTRAFFYGGDHRDQRQFSQEIELLSASGGSLEWMVGAFYFHEKGYEFDPQNFLYVLDTNQAVFTTDSFGALAPLLQAGNPAQFRGVVQSTALGYRVTGESKAIYGQATWRPQGPEGALGLTLGLRYSWDKKSTRRFQNGASPFTDPAEIALNNQSAKFSAPTGHLTVDYRASRDVNLYGRIAHGYRSGGFNLRQSTQLDNPATLAVNEAVPLIPFNEEKIWSYEVGAKMEFANRLRLNSALFYNVYTDQLATIPIPIVGGGSFGTQVVNAGRSEYLGAELEAQLYLAEGFSLDGSVGYVDVKIKEFPQADVTGAIRNIAEIISPAYAPEWTVNAGATFKRQLGSDARLTARVGMSYLSSAVLYVNPLNAPFQEATNTDSRMLVDAQIKVDELSIAGAKASITIWGKNLTNKAYVARSVDFGQLGFASAIYGDPRTVGVTLDFNF